MTQHIFFKEFGINPNSKIKNASSDSTYLHNCMILEIANNWPFVRWLMCRYRDGMLKEVDQLEKDWFNFIIQNNIDVEKYQKDFDKFIEEHLKISN